MEIRQQEEKEEKTMEGKKQTMRLDREAETKKEKVGKQQRGRKEEGRENYIQSFLSPFLIKKLQKEQNEF